MRQNQRTIFPKPTEYSAQPLGTIAALAPTVTHLFGLAAPQLSAELPLAPVIQYGSDTLGSEKVEKCLIFAPDALGAQIWPKCDDAFQRIMKYAPLQIALRSIVPPKTPVCFASMFTGAQPPQHGIRQYERPVVKCDTLFDALIRGEKSVGVVAVKDSSIDLIFRGRKMHYFSEPYDQDVEARALELVANADYAVIIAYQQEYDDTLHKTHPFSRECLEAVAHHIQSFEIIAEAARSRWMDLHHAIIFAPDHGAHTNPTTGKGDHGEDIPEDMLLFHWYGIARGNRAPHNKPARLAP